MKLNHDMKKADPSYVGSYRKSEIEKVAEVFDMVSQLNREIELAGYKAPKSKVRTVEKKGYKHVFID